jgi:MoxR-like ATPase
VVDHLLVALFARGHVLLEGPPGTAKTFLAQSFATALGLDFGRIQFTPDLMPGDILGSNLFNFQTSQFTLTRGPIFCEVLLADEINRTPPKTQAALLEAMQERRVTLDGAAHPLPPLYGGGHAEPDRAAGRLSAARGAARPLPLQTARRLPRRGRGLAIVTRYGQQSGPPDPRAQGVHPVADAATLAAATRRGAGDAGRAGRRLYRAPAARDA